MRNTRKLFCTLLVAALLALTIAPAYAATVDTSTAKIYMGSKDNNYWGYGEININDITGSTKITEIKSTNTKVVRVSRLNRWSSINESLDEDGEDSSYYDAAISYNCLKKGKAAVTFKVDGKQYTKNIEVLSFVNPIKTFTLTGIDKTNLKSKFAKYSYVHAKLKSDAKAGYLNVAAASGWKITRAEWYDEGDNSNISTYSPKGVSSVKLAVPKMSKKGNYYVWLSFVNTKTGATADFSYNLSK